MHGCLPVAPAACLCSSREPPLLRAAGLLLIKPAARSSSWSTNLFNAPPHRSILTEKRPLTARRLLRRTALALDEGVRSPAHYSARRMLRIG